MNRTPIRWLMLLMVAALLAPTATLAGEGETKGKIDEISQAALDAWNKMAYSAGALGAKRASAACVGAAEGMMGKLDAKGTYVWDGKKGKLAWNNAMLAQAFQMQGLDAGTIDGIFESKGFEDELKGVTLTGTKTESGVEVAVTGVSDKGVQGLRFNAEGHLTTVKAAQEAPGMGKMQFEVVFSYEKKGDKQRMTGWVVNVDLGPQGKVVDTTTITWTTVGAYDVYAKIVSTATMGGQSAGTKTMVLSDWKFNDDVKVEAAAGGSKSRKGDDGCDGCDEGDDDGCDDGDDDGCDEGDDDDDGCDDGDDD